MVKIALRNIMRNKASSFINIAGLSVGLSCVLLIVLFIQDEFSYDRFFKKADRIYQVNLEGNFGGTEFLAGTTPPPAGSALVNAFPEIKTYTRIYRPNAEVVRYGENQSVQSFFTEANIAGVDSNFFQVFDYKLREGNAATCLLPVNALVITEKVAKKYFGNAPAMGKTLLFGNDKQPFVVTGVLQNIPAQSSLQYDMFRPIASYPVVKRFSWSWVWLQVSTYVVLDDRAANDRNSMQKLESKFPAMVRQQAATAFKRIGQPLDEFQKKGGKWNLHLQPLTDIHLRSENVQTFFTNLGDIKQVYIFSVVAIFIMLLACVNFMNLSTAQSARRAKEVGIRKVLGSVKKQLVRQFLLEALLYSCIAGLIAFCATLLLLDAFNQLAEKSFSADDLFRPRVLLYLIGLILISGLMAGSYPAFYLTSFKPVNVLKGRFFTAGGNHSIRNGLVVFQFTISTALIICTVVVFEQLKYTKSKDMGLSKDNLLVISNTDRLEQNEESFRQEVEALPEVEAASVTSSLPTKNSFGDFYLPLPNGKEQLAKDITLSSYMVDEKFIPSLKLQLIQGRNFSKEFNDSTSVIVNEETVREIGWKNPIGEWLEYPGNNNQRFKVIGVVRDFNTTSLRAPMMAFALFHASSKTYGIGTSFVLAKLKPGNTAKTIQTLEKKWKSFTANTPFDYSFLDQEFDALYRNDKRTSLVFNVFTLLAIFVACLGLFGLAAYTAERRTKEIGIRKVLGASVRSLAALLSKDFIGLVFIASVIAFPLAWWYMDQWLEGFAYRITISWWIFIGAAALALIIALATVSFQAIKAAMANPVKSLRTE